VDFHINGGFLQQFVSSVDSLGPRCIDRSAVVMPQERVEAVGARMIAAVGVKDLGQWGRYVRKNLLGGAVGVMDITLVTPRSWDINNWGL